MSKSSGGGSSRVAGPLALVVEHLALVPAGGQVLDVACGGGRHMRAALRLGFHVTGIDRDLAGVEDLAGQSGVTLIEADLETGGRLPTAGRRFDAVIVTNYLWRPLLPDIVGAVGDAGVLIYETFGAGNGRYGRPSNPDFLLEPGELLEAVRGVLVPVVYHHRLDAGPSPAIRQGLVAIGRRHVFVINNRALRGAEQPKI